MRSTRFKAVQFIRSIERALLALVVVGCGSAQSLAQTDLTLPVLRIEIEPDTLEQLNRTKWHDDQYPATFVVDGQSYACRVRYRGTTARGLPKKSWRIAFDDDHTPFGARVLYLNAEYRDASLMRNHLAMRLFHHFGYPASNTRYVNLFVNDAYLGVHLQVERVDEDFLERRGRDPGPLVKAVDHSANFAPLLFDEHYDTAWEQKIGDRDDYRELKRLLAQMAYWSPDTFEAEVERRVDVDNVLTFFAAQFFVANQDGFIKNFYLHRAPESGRYEIFPWDNDATFGNTYQGAYRSGTIKYYAYGGIASSVLFQRLIEYPAWETRFWEKVQQIVDHGAPFLKMQARATYEAIRHDVYQDDQHRVGRAGFDFELTRLLNFIDQRAAYLRTAPPYTRVRLSNLDVSNAFPTPDSASVTFRVRAEAPIDNLEIVYTTDLVFNQPHAVHTQHTLPLFDDGLHDDAEAGDLIYGNTLDTATDSAGVIPFTVRYGYLKYPHSGFASINYHPTLTYALNARGVSQDAYEELTFGQVQLAGSERMIPIVNRSTETIDLSMCRFHAGVPYQQFTIPPGTLLDPGQTLVLATNVEAARWFYGDTGNSDEPHPLIEPLWFFPAAGDTLRLLSPTHKPLQEHPASEFAVDHSIPGDVVLNEVNFSGAESSDPGDWLELYNPESIRRDLSGWMVKDEDDDHTYTFPPGAYILPHGYLVLARDTAALHAAFPKVMNLYGEFDFGFGAEDAVRLFNPIGEQVDALRYSVASGEAAPADGSGLTFERIDPNGHSDQPANWTASLVQGGNTGFANSVSLSSEGGGVPETYLEPGYPNPFREQVHLSYGLARTQSVELRVYDVAGRLLSRIDEAVQQPGRHDVVWDARAYGAGLYVVELRVEGASVATRSVVMVH